MKAVNLLVIGCAACVPPPPQTTTPVYVSSSATASIEANVMPVDTRPMAPAARAVQVFIDKRIPRPTELLGVLDFHTDATSEDKGFDELRIRAAELGGEAVIGAEFEHGEGDGPSHLSGMVVRFLDHD